MPCVTSGLWCEVQTIVLYTGWQMSWKVGCWHAADQHRQSLLKASHVLASYEADSVWLPTRQEGSSGSKCAWTAAGLHRQCLFGGLRIGLYEPVKKVYMGDRPPTDAPLYLKVAAGLTTGAVAIAIASPTDLVKVSTPERACWSTGRST